jgi:hypothetical protein
MGTPTTDPIAIGILVVIGGLSVALLRKLNIKIKNIYVFTLTLWGIGFGLAYSGYVLYESQSVLYLSYVLLAIGGTFLLASCSIFFFTLLNPPPQTKSFKESKIESSFGYRLGKRLGEWVRRRK